MKVVDVQTALAKLGFKPGPIDGVWGRQSIAALRAFQSKVGIEVDGIPGPITLSMLFPGEPQAQGLDSVSMPWLNEARRLLGTREKPGAGSNKDIIDWASELGITYKSDDIPWCGLFVGHCIGSTLDREALPTSLLSARSWERFGIRTEPTLGAVMVFWRKSTQSGLGHVGFYTGEDETAYRIIGGNQSDSVSLAWVRKDRLVASRWPSTVSPPSISRPRVRRDEQLSTNEK